MRKVFYVIIPILVLILVGEFAYVSVLDKKDTKNEVVDKDNTEDKDVDKDSPLYRIYYHTDSDYYNASGNICYYDFIITENYDVLSAKKKIAIKETLNNQFTLDTIMEELKNTKHDNNIKLNDNQKKILKKILENQNYNIVLGEKITLNSRNDYYVANYGKNMVLKNNGDVNLEQVINALAQDNVTYFDYITRSNNVDNYIKDKDYQELDITSEIIKNLYSKIISTSLREESEYYSINYVDERYITQKITNNTIVTLTLNKILDDMQYVEMNFEELYSGEKIYVLLDKFDERAKEIFGPNVVYNIFQYEGGRNGQFIYRKDEKGLYLMFVNGGGETENIITHIEKAYQVNNKIVIVEKSLFEMLECGSGSLLCSKYDDSIRLGLYNNVHDKIYLQYNYYCEVENKLSKYNQFVTYYSYTFTKGEDGNYYYTDFSRLN